MAHKNRQVFIVRIWREPREIEGELPEWRGEIESIQTGEQRYLKSLDEIIIFIKPFLEKMGVRVETRWRLSRWLKSHKQTVVQNSTKTEP